MNIKYLFSLLLGITVCVPGYAVYKDGASHRSSVTTQLQRSTQDSVQNNVNVNLDVSDVNNKQGKSEKEETVSKNADDYARQVCLGNDIGIGNTFVWASRYSNTDNYSTMVEDTQNYDNNTCFVFVEVRSLDKDVSLNDIKGKYFPMGTYINCGSWVDKKVLEKKVLDSKKSTRVFAGVAGGIGGAGIGVGMMELFGNKLLANAGVKSVQGQKALKGDELFISQLKVMKKSDDSRYGTIVNELKEIKAGCAENPIPECNDINYETILKALEE